MARSRHESHHSEGITDQKSLQRTFATKSALSRHELVHRTCPLSGVKQTWLIATQMSAYDPKRTFIASIDTPPTLDHKLKADSSIGPSRASLKRAAWYEFETAAAIAS